MDSLLMKDLKFTLVHRKIIFVYTNIRVSEEDFIKHLSEENKVKWLALDNEERIKLWTTLKKNFVFEVSEQNQFDPHNNWIEAWDIEEDLEVEEKWTDHPWVKEEVSKSMSELEGKLG